MHDCRYLAEIQVKGVMRNGSDNESDDCGVRLVPISVKKSRRSMEQELRKEIKFLTSLRQEYEVNMLEVEKELLDEKIQKRELEEQRLEFLEAVSKSRLQWQQEKWCLERELMEEREKVAELKNKLMLKEEVVKELDKTNKFMKHQLTLNERCPPVMAKVEKVAEVDNIMMELISAGNQPATNTSCLERLGEHNKELQQIIENLVGENTNMKHGMEKLQVQVSTLRQENEKHTQVDVRRVQENFEKVELLRESLIEKNSASKKSLAQLLKLQKKLLKKEKLADRLVAWVKVRNRIEAARDTQEVLTIGDKVLGSEKRRNLGVGEGGGIGEALLTAFETISKKVDILGFSILCQNSTSTWQSLVMKTLF